MKKSTKFAMVPIAAIVLSTLALSGQASEPWTSTKTEAFLARVHTHDSAGNEVTADQIAVDVAAGELKSITVSLQLRNTDQLDNFLKALHTPGNPSYHKFLTPEQFLAQYGPTQAQVDAVVAHLSKSGFKNISVSPNHTLISADGTAAAVTQAFNTSLKRFTHNGRNVYANDREAQVPASLANIVGSVLGLQNAAIHHATHSGIQPQKTTTTTAAGSEVTHIPTQYPGIYGAVTTPVASNAIVGTIAEGNMTYTLQDFATFLSNNPSLPKLTPTVVYVGGENTSDESGEVEWALDSQVIYGTAGALKQLIFYTASSMEDAPLTAAYNAAVTANVASVVNVSLGECEADAKSSGSQAADDTVFKQAVAQGITFSVAAGDAGPYNCAVDSVGTPGVAKSTTQKKTYDVSEPASSPYVMAIGGTALFTTSSGAYNGQAVWNEGTAATNDGTNNTRIWSTGGGFSANEPAPTWQTASIVGSGHSTRGLPDLVFDAASASGTNIYINQAANGTAYAPVGGTSMASPIFVGIWARLESAHSNNLGFPASALYGTIPSNSGLIFPVTSATVDGDSVNYTGWSTSYPGMKAAASGWSAATGFGSLNIDAVNAYITAHPTVFPPK
jgi:pseudomonalisin